MKKLLLILSLALSTTAFSQVPSYVPSSGLVGWWPFTGNAIDSSGNGNNGTVTGATLTTDRFGNANSAYYFPGDINNKISVTHNSTLNFTNEFTVSVWAKFDQTWVYHEEDLVYKTPNPHSSDKGWTVWAIENSGYSIGGFIGAPSNTGFYAQYYGISFTDIDIWSHIVFVYSNYISKVYFNGNLVLTGTNPLTCDINTTSDLFFGGSANPVSGANNRNIDDIGIWNRALDSCEVKDLYFASLGNCIGVGINEVSQSNIFTVYPNPTNSALTINTSVNYSSIQIVNTLGQLVFTKEKSTSLNVSSLPSGIYFIQLVDIKGSVIGKEKFVKE